MHCISKPQAQLVLRGLEGLFRECGLELHSEKTKIVFCKDHEQRKMYPHNEFTFLWHHFKTRWVKSKKHNRMVAEFTTEVNKAAQKSMRERIRESGLRRRTELSLEEIAKMFNPILNGWRTILPYGLVWHSEAF